MKLVAQRRLPENLPLVEPDGEVFVRWETSRAAECLDRPVPADFKGTIQCDGYAGYQSFAKSRSEIKLAACWAHARRKFHEALEQSCRVLIA